MSVGLDLNVNKGDTNNRLASNSMHGKHDHSRQAEGKGTTMGEDGGLGMANSDGSTAILHVLPPGERHFGSSNSKSNKLKACHNQQQTGIFLGNLFLINESHTGEAAGFRQPVP